MRTAVIALLLATTACPVTLPSAQDLEFACDSDDQCLSGYHCSEKVCVPSRPHDSGEVLDISAGDQRLFDTFSYDAAGDGGAADVMPQDRVTPADALPVDSTYVDSTTVDSTWVDGSRADAFALDTVLTSDIALPDVVFDAALPDAALPDVALFDVAPADVAPADAALPDAAPSDVALPDAAPSDVALPDVTASDAVDAAIADSSPVDTGGVEDAASPADTWNAPDAEPLEDAFTPDAACEDDDGDGHCNKTDNCPKIYNPDQLPGDCAPLSCFHIHRAGQSTGNGVYWIDPNGIGGGDAFQVYCDMESDSRGWTLAFLKNSVHTGDYSSFGASNQNLSSLMVQPDIASTSDTPHGGWLDINNFPYSVLRLGAYRLGAETYLSENIGRHYLQIPFGQDGYWLNNSLHGYYWCGGSAGYANSMHCKGHTGLGAGWDFSNNDVPNRGLTMCGTSGANWMYGGFQQFQVFYPQTGAAQAIWLSGGACGDGAVDGVFETCDDGNTTAGDGCSATCSVETTALSCLEILESGASVGSGFYQIDPDLAGPGDAFDVYCEMNLRGGGWSVVAVYGMTPRPQVWSGNSYPRPGASFYGAFDPVIFDTAANDRVIANYSINARDVWTASNNEVLAYVGGVTDDYIHTVLPDGCNFFDGSTWCEENSHGPLLVYDSADNLVTERGQACTTAHGAFPFGLDGYNEFGLHLIEERENSLRHCFTGDSTLGFESVGRIFGTFERDDGGYWNRGVHSYWHASGQSGQPGALLIR